MVALRKLRCRAQGGLGYSVDLRIDGILLVAANGAGSAELRPAAKTELCKIRAVERQIQDLSFVNGLPRFLVFSASLMARRRIHP